MKLRYVDKVHGYWFNGKRCKGVSTVAKIPEDGYALDQWRKRMVLQGVSEQEALAVAARTFPGDKDVLNELAELAMREAKAHEAAERGSQVHATTEAHDLGQAVEDEYSAERWAAILDGAGFDVVDELIEQIVVFPDQNICGRFDRFAIRRHDGKLCVLDLKTGESAVRYPHSTVIQLAMYANAPLLAQDLKVVNVDDDGYVTLQTEQFTALPDNLDRKVGYVIFVPDDGSAAVYAANLEAGWKAVNDIIIPTLAWRKRGQHQLLRRAS